MTTILTSRSAELNERLILALARSRADGKSAYRVAAEAEVHPSELSKWANGHRAPSCDQARRLSVVLGEPLAALFPDLNDATPAGTGAESEIDEGIHRAADASTA